MTPRDLSNTLIAVGLLVVCPPGARAQTEVSFTLLHSFDRYHGARPEGALMESGEGTFYGTTPNGGIPPVEFSEVNNGYGTVFQITADGVFTSLHLFNAEDGQQPFRAPILASDGNLYGLTQGGGLNLTWCSQISGYCYASGWGTVFRIAEGAGAVPFHLFSRAPEDTAVLTMGPSKLIQGSDGDFYGTTQYGGTYRRGTVFKLTPGGVMSTLATFNLTNGRTAVTLVEGSDGNFYGATKNGGDDPTVVLGVGSGTLFRVTPAGEFTRLHSFSGTDGLWPTWTLFQASDGNFYGTTARGGASNQGTIFRFAADGALDSFYSFGGSDGAGPSNEGLLQASDGNLYGITREGGPYTNANPRAGDILPLQGLGTFFRISLDGTLTTLYSFDGTNSSRFPVGLTQGSDGAFYVTTWGDPSNSPTGESPDYGAILRLTVAGADKPKILSATTIADRRTITWLALRGRSYQLQFTHDLSQPNWTDVGNSTTATNSMSSAIDAGPIDRQRFYRVILLP